jgi:hypothetical protein
MVFPKTTISDRAANSGAEFAQNPARVLRPHSPRFSAPENWLNSATEFNAPHADLT